MHKRVIHYASRIALVHLVLATAAVAQPTAASKTPTQTLAEARSEFRSGSFDKAAPLLTFLLYPQPRLSASNDLTEAYLLLGLCHFEAENFDAATKEIETALFLNPELTLNAATFSPPARKFFEQVKKDKEKQDKENAEIRRLAEERDALAAQLANTRIVEKRSFYVNFVPFGAGQFQNGHRTKGIVLFSTQMALGGTSAGIFTYQVLKYGLGGSVPQEEIDTVNTLRTVQVATGVIALGFMAYGIVDALAYYEKEIVLKPAGKPPSLLDSKNKSALLRMPLVYPLATDSTVGVGLGWRY